VQRPHVNDVVADEQIGPRAGAPRADPNAATLGPMTLAGRTMVNASAPHGSAGLKFGKMNGTRGFSAMAERKNRLRSSATEPVAQTIFTRSAGFFPSSHSMRPHA
jgi:hypothetical protein